MASFFEKLKKGMEIKNTPNIKEADTLSNVKNELDSFNIEKETNNPKEAEHEKLSDIEEIPATYVEKVSIKKSSLGNLISEDKDTKKKKRKKRKADKPEPTHSASISDETKKKKISVKEVEEKKEIEREEEIQTEIKGKKWFESEGHLVIDVYETNGEIVIQSAIAGINPEDLDIDIENDTVTIKGSRQKSVEKKGRNYFYQECHWGCFSREIILPAEVDAGRAEAKMENGVLTIRMPKIEREGRKKITVKE